MTMLFKRSCTVQLVLALIALSLGIARGDDVNPKNPAELKEALDHRDRQSDLEKIIRRRHVINESLVKAIAQDLYSDLKKHSSELAEVGWKVSHEQEYAGELTVRFMLCTLVEYRISGGKVNNKTIDTKAIYLAAKNLAYVNVASNPSGASLFVGNIQFDPTKSDGFVPIKNSREKLIIKLTKKGYEDFAEEVELVTGKRNEFSFDLVRNK